MTSKTLFVLAIAAQVLGVEAIWPFPEKRYSVEGLVNAGPLGIESGRVIAVGDWNGDQQYALNAKYWVMANR
jgi:integrin alpha FG-GAP repeat containing protein 1